MCSMFCLYLLLLLFDFRSRERGTSHISSFFSNTTKVRCVSELFVSSFQKGHIHTYIIHNTNTHIHMYISIGISIVHHIISSTLSEVASSASKHTHIPMMEHGSREEDKKVVKMGQVNFPTQANA